MLAVAVIAPSLVLAAALNVQVTTPANNVVVGVNENVSFDVSATGGNPASYGYSWTFGDGQGANIKNPTHAYTSTGTTTARVQVTDIAGNTGDAQVTVVVTAGGPCTPLIVETPVEAQPKATNVTKDSATIVWTTCEASTSRVVYDTVSHPTVTDTANLGYANSTTIDNTKVTTHSVNLTGLSANTKYYFRVLSAR